jgi:lactoylglutathione lyase
MNFGYTIIYVDDVPATLAFYEKAFGLATRFLHESNGYGELETGATALAFAAHEVAEQNLPGGYSRISPEGQPCGMEIGLTTTDVPGAFEKAVAAGATPLSEPKTKPWGQVVAYVRSIEGTLVELCSPMVAP